MAYVTDLSYEEILNRLKMQTDINFQFEKESADNKDKSLYFRNALVRSNYGNIPKGIYPTF